MSRARQRPTREETRDRLLRAAAKLFSDKGIGNTSIEDICDEADFSRGAFYSNFKAKDELAIELLDVHMRINAEEIDRLYEESRDPTDFVRNIDSPLRRRRTGPLDIEDGGILYVELLLFALRNPENRPKIVQHQRELRRSNIGVLQKIVEATGRDYPMPLDDVASFILALDLGTNLQQHIDPDSYRPAHFAEFITMVHQLWLNSPDDPDALPGSR